VIVYWVTVDMMDMKVLNPTTEGASLPVTLKNFGTNLFPSPQCVLLPRPYGDPELFADGGTSNPRGKGAVVAEGEVPVSRWMAAAERLVRSIECVQTQLQVGAHCSNDGQGNQISNGMGESS
jgi:hypothetical protein